MSKTPQHIDAKTKSSKLNLVLPDFDLKPNKHLLHLSYLRQLSNKRSGTASTKTRSEVRGGGAKPWKQKGTGRARVGSIRSPLWVGGGVAHGPKPRSFDIKLPQKERNLAIAQAFVAKQEDLIKIKELPELKACKTKEFLASIKPLNIKKLPALFVYSQSDSNFKLVIKASRNLKDIELKDSRYIGVHDLLKSNTVVITEKALGDLNSRLSRILSGGDKNES